MNNENIEFYLVTNNENKDNLVYLFSITLDKKTENDLQSFYYYYFNVNNIKKNFSINKIRNIIDFSEKYNLKLKKIESKDEKDKLIRFICYANQLDIMNKMKNTIFYNEYFEKLNAEDNEAIKKATFKF